MSRRQPTRFGLGAGHGRIAAAAELLAEHRPVLLRAARRVSICEADAEDALQRASEHLLNRAPEGIGQDRLTRWMYVVVRREALAIRRRRERSVSRIDEVGDGSFAERQPAETPTPPAVLEFRERRAEAATLLGRLKPQERRAIGLQAAGCSYAEIQAITGWTPTKVNRCLVEGRAALRAAGAMSDAA